jgi:L-asparaginase
MKAKRVLILYTGGTFGMTATSKGSGSMSMPKLNPAGLRQRFLKNVPELSQLAHCDVDVVMNRDSAHVGPAEWKALAARIQKRWSKYDGIVILHGTDTLAYTASALSFLLRPCRKPVILTGAQRPLAALRTDARRNLMAAVEIAARGPRPAKNQVKVFFDDRLLRGNRVRKRSASEFGAFESPKFPALAMVGTEIRYAPAGGKPSGSPKLRPEFNAHVALLHATPGFPARHITQSLLPELNGLVLVVFPSGTAPTHDPEFIRLLRAARRLDIPVVTVSEGVSQPPSGRANPGTYEAGRKLIEEGCFWSGEMTPECAYVKASLLLGQARGRRRFAALWKRELAGEGSGHS